MRIISYNIGGCRHPICYAIMRKNLCERRMSMSVKRYHKLVRDRIPEIIEQSGKTCTTRILSEEEYLAMLDEKLSEELAEYQQDKSMEELADLLEVMMAVAKARGSSFEEVETIRRQKAEKRGGFEKRILLTEVHENENTNRF